MYILVFEIQKFLIPVCEYEDQCIDEITLLNSIDQFAHVIAIIGSGVGVEETR